MNKLYICLILLCGCEINTVEPSVESSEIENSEIKTTIETSIETKIEKSIEPTTYNVTKEQSVEIDGKIHEIFIIYVDGRKFRGVEINVQ